ncbi:hypothetical protein [Paenibacillus aceris]|uniref:Ribosomal protein S13 n=1 Tax=Paenibacillus aceris TaxID=869555 RepID=A0ABS4I5S0_9BACL|nr:hypothetical protein [Paenibacillus aceris]MBP1965876.1 ribosomal protein S13 [Paenibacillus aceris]NHW35122.1 hypothetical protein [Paenibacillus aceris]
MKLIHKKVLVGTLAAGLLISGGLVLQHNQAFADETSTATPAPQQDKLKDNQHRDFRGHKDQGHGPVKGGFEFGKGGPFDFAAVLGIDPSVLKEEIKQGKTLVQIAQDKANLTEDALLAKLTETETKKIDDALAAGKIKQEQADKMKAGLADRLKKIVESKPRVMDFKGAAVPGPRGGMMPGGMFGNSAEIATILGITEDELNTQRKAGKSLAEIAQDKGITEDQLIAKLKDNLTDELKSFVERKGGVPTMKSEHNGFKFKGKPAQPAAPAPTAAPQ